MIFDFIKILLFNLRRRKTGTRVHCRPLRNQGLLNSPFEPLPTNSGELRNARPSLSASSGNKVQTIHLRSWDKLIALDFVSRYWASCIKVTVQYKAIVGKRLNFIRFLAHPVKYFVQLQYTWEMFHLSKSTVQFFSNHKHLSRFSRRSSFSDQLGQ